MERGRLEELFARFRDRGDVAALGEVFDATAPDLLRVARRVTRDRAEAEDVLQSTFLAAIEGAKGFDAQRELRPWLVGVLVRQAGLARRRRSAPIPSAAMRPHSGSDPADALVAREISESIALALEKLSPEDREVLVPLLVDGRRAVDIARELDRRPDTISMRIHRGLARLRRLLAPGIGLGWIATLLARRGLASVRREVLLRARWTGATGIAAPVAAGIGGTILVNKLILSAAALVALASAWFAIQRSSIGARGAERIEIAGRAIPSIEPGKLQPGSDVDGPARTETTPRSTMSAPRAGSTVVEIVDNDGRSVVAAPILIARDEMPVQDFVSDARGRIALGADGRSVRLYVLRPRTMPLCMEIALDGAEHRIELPLGREVSGRVRVDGKVPDPPIRLSLRFAEPPFGGAPEERQIARRLGCESYEHIVLEQVTEADGSFRWSGLPEAWSGAVDVPRIFTLPDAPRRSFGNQELALEGPASGISIDLESLPSFRGRIVDARDGSPVPRAEVTFVIEWSEKEDSTRYGASADNEGRFEIPIIQPDIAAVEIEQLTDAKGRGRIRPGLRWDPLGAVRDLGDIPLDRPESRKVEFVVRGEDGNPIAGAVGVVGERMSQPTDEKGCGVLEFLPLDTECFQVAARGFWSRSVQIPDPIEGPIPTTLEAGNELSIEIAGLDPGLRDRIDLHLLSTSPLFPNSGHWLPSWAHTDVVAGGCSSCYDPNASRTQGTALCSLDANGRLVLGDLVSGEPITLQVFGPFEELLHEEALPSLSRSEHRSTVITVAVGGNRVSGLVLAGDGSPIQGADVLVQNERSIGIWRRTGHDGSFLIPGLRGGEFRLSIKKRGWVAREIPLLVGATSPSPVEVRLEPGHDLAVDILDAHGAHVLEARARVRDPSTGREYTGHEDRSGRLHIDDLPPTSCELTVYVAGDILKRMHDALVPEVRIDLPALGRVEVQWSRREEPDTQSDAGYQVVLRPTDPAHGPLKHWTAASLRGSHAFPAVFPGEYLAQFERYFPNEVDGGVRVEPIGPSVRFVVEADQTARVTL